MTFEDKLMINGEEKKAEGKAEGKTEEQERIIHTMIQEGLDEQTIARYVSDLTEEQVSEIRQKVTTPKDQNGVSPE